MSRIPPSVSSWRLFAVRPFALPALAVGTGVILAHRFAPDARALAVAAVGMTAAALLLRSARLAWPLPLLLLALAAAGRAVVADPHARADSVARFAARHAGEKAALLGVVERGRMEAGKFSGVVAAERLLMSGSDAPVEGRVRVSGARARIPDGAEGTAAEASRRSSRRRDRRIGIAEGESGTAMDFQDGGGGDGCGIVVGQRVLVRGELAQPRGLHNFEPMPWEAMEHARGVGAALRAGEVVPVAPPPASARCRARIIAGCDAVLARAMGDAERALLMSALFGAGEAEKDTARSFADSGLLHLLVVSGQQVTMLSFALLRLAGRFGPAAGVIGVAVYAWLCGPDPAVMRAAVMAFILLAGRAAGRAADSRNSLYAAFCLLLLVDPAAALTPGFWFTFLITLAILHASALPLRGRARAGAVFAAANLASLPVALVFFAAAPLTGILAQLPAIALFDAALASLAFALFPAMLVPSAAPLLLLPARVCAATLLALARLFSEFRLFLPAGGVLPFAASGFIGAGACLLVRRALPRIPARWRDSPAARALPAAVGLLLFAAPALPLRPHPVMIEFLDVGQGDAALLRDGTAAALIDTGDGRSDAFLRVVRPHLDRAGLHTLSAIFLSHLDADHAGGAGAAARHAPRAPLYLPESLRGTKELKGFLAAQEIAPQRVRFLARGDEVPLGRFRIRALWPPRGEAFSDDNAGSLVLAIVAEGVTALFPGDLTASSEARLVAMGLPRAGILKVSHHGAAGSSIPDFLRAVQPAEAVLSAAFPNRFGHPASATLRTLLAAGAVPRFTADLGMVRYTLRGGERIVHASRRN